MSLLRAPLNTNARSPLHKPLRNPLLAPYRHAIGALVVFGFVSNVLMLMPTLYMLQVFDRVMVSRSELTLLAVSAIALYLFGMLVMLWNTIMTMVTGRSVSAPIPAAAAHA